MQSDRPLRPISKEALADLQTWYPVDRWKTDPPADLFEIGLVLAGGQSSGCYLAGVLDFLFEALDCWQAARRAEPDRFPNHRVKIKILVGASAGGLNAALAAICGRYRFTPASHTRFEDGDKNLESPFYRAWVPDIDIIDLLSTDDLRIDGKNFSLLNSDYLERKVASYLNFGRDGAASAIQREWLDDPLPLKITVSNLEGVPFRICFSADRSNGANDSSFPMTLHRDYLAFLRPLAKAAQPPNVPDSDVLPFDNSNADSGWQRLGQAILATIAFPFALKRRPIERPSTDYDYRYVYPSDSGELVYAPGFPGDKPAERQFTAIDGGVFDNEPFELAHAALAGSMGTNKREGSLAKRAILIDPFVTPKLQMSAGDDSMLLRFITKFWNSLIEQNQFKPIDLSLAEASDVYSRFMIGPLRRSGEKTARGDLALASHPPSVTGITISCLDDRTVERFYATGSCCRADLMAPVPHPMAPPQIPCSGTGPRKRWPMPPSRASRRTARAIVRSSRSPGQPRTSPTSVRGRRANSAAMRLLNRRSKIASTLSIQVVATRSSTPRLQAELDAGSADWRPTPISCFRDGGICWRRSKPPSMRHALRSIAVSTRGASRKPLMGERHAGRGWLARSGL